jgi:hypothetical protein
VPTSFVKNGLWILMDSGASETLGRADSMQIRKKLKWQFLSDGRFSKIAP